MSHSYLLNYTEQLTSINQGANMWMYNHFNAAHEESGQHAQTLDDDLTEFLDRYLSQFGDDNEIVIVI
jgi:hypothetical protein